MSAPETRPDLCPVCGGDCAYVIPAADGFQVICDPAFGGCAATGVAGDSEAEAVTIWNAGLYISTERKVA